MPPNRRKKITTFFDGFDDRQFNGKQRIFKRIGTASILIGFGAQACYYALSHFVDYTQPTLPIYVTIIEGLFVGGILLGVLMFILIAVYDLGRRAGHNSFVGSLLLALGKVCLYLFLPAIIVTAILFGVVALIR